jgi:beta-N-acetylhexosaminidase
VTTRLLHTLLILLLIALGSGLEPPSAAGDSAQIAEIIATLTPEERVGQLILVTFEGSQSGPETAVAQLIRDYNIGGVVLLAENDNIDGQVNTPRLVLSLTTALQQLAYDSAQATAGRDTPRAFVPLLIGTTDGGNGQPETQITAGTTPLPSLMAIGATWNPDNARTVGQIAGSELSAMGINLLLGPALDVSQPPQTGDTLDLGVNTFGGEPYWVGKMGQSYITGVHEGSQGRIAVVAQHFPGLGMADTPPDQEIPVVPRTVEQMRQFDLIPYAAVTGNAGGTLARADGLQCASLRYQGDSERPLCLDEQATSALFRLDELNGWREQGIVVSSALGTPALRRYYNVSPFPHRQIAREAFLAGNDLLYLADFGPQPGTDQLANVRDVIEFFAELYQSDPVFRAQVDDSLTRILRLKLKLYADDLTLSNILTPTTAIERVGQSDAVIYTMAQQSVTLLAPRRENLPGAPSRRERIVIVTDVRQVQQCSYCATTPQVSVNALEAAIERRYGPYADAQIRPEQVVSFSFAQLQSYLQGDVTGLSPDSNEYKTNRRIAEALRDTDWIVLVMLDPSPEVSLVRDLLGGSTDLIDRNRVIVIALGTPTALSSTEISRFAAYYGLYSSIPAYIDAAARAVFQESSFPGALPISLPATGYDVFQVTAPDPDQTLQIEVDSDASALAAEPVTLATGQPLDLRTLPILDRNSHPVPDGTPVEFAITFVTDNLQTRQTATTQDGIAHTRFKPVRPGRVQITASSRDASRSLTMQIMVVDDLATPTSGVSPSPEATIAVRIEVTPESSPAPAAHTPNDDTPARLEALDLVLTLLGLALLITTGFFAGRSAAGSMAAGLRVALSGLVAGLTGYIYYGAGGPGIREFYNLAHRLAPLIASLLAGLAGSLAAWGMLRRK